MIIQVLAFMMADGVMELYGDTKGKRMMRSMIA